MKRFVVTTVERSLVIGHLLLLAHRLDIRQSEFPQKANGPSHKANLSCKELYHGGRLPWTGATLANGRW